MTQSSNVRVRPIEPFTLISSAKRDVIRRFMTQQSGLEPNQFVISSYGFPPIPIPEPRKMSRKTRLAPDNVNNTFLGHPIYWIDPALTTYNPERESDEVWAVRMFYLIASFGYFNENIEWIDFLEKRGFDYNMNEIHRYHRPSNPACFADTDEYKWLTEEDLPQPLSYVQATAMNALVVCQSVLGEELAHLNRNQVAAYTQAVSIIGKDSLYSPNGRFDDPNGYFYRAMNPALYKILNEFTARVEGGHSIAAMTDSVTDTCEGIAKTLETIDTFISVLAVPSIRDSEDKTEEFTAQMAYLELAHFHDKESIKNYDFTDLYMNALVNQRTVDSMKLLIKAIIEQYESCWKRLRLATVNFERLVSGLETYSNYGEFTIDSITQRGSTDGELSTPFSDNLEGGRFEDEPFNPYNNPFGR